MKATIAGQVETPPSLSASSSVTCPYRIGWRCPRHRNEWLVAGKSETASKSATSIGKTVSSAGSTSARPNVVKRPLGPCTTNGTKGRQRDFAREVNDGAGAPKNGSERYGNLKITVIPPRPPERHCRPNRFSRVPRLECLAAASRPFGELADTVTAGDNPPPVATERYPLAVVLPQVVGRHRLAVLLIGFCHH